MTKNPDGSKLYMLPKGYKVDIDGLPYWVERDTIVKGWHDPYEWTLDRYASQKQAAADQPSCIPDTRPLGN